MIGINNFHPSWKPMINLLYQEPLKTLFEIVLPYISYQPRGHQIFKVFEMPLEDIKVVILGDEPSIIPEISNGYAYAVDLETPITESLRIIKSEITEGKSDEDGYISEEGFASDLVYIDEVHPNVLKEEWKTLKPWRDQGVFLLNTALTVRTGEMSSHEEFWLPFIRNVIKFISNNNPCIWMLWGDYCKSFAPYIHPKKSVFMSDYNDENFEDLPSSEYLNYILESPKPVQEIGLSKSKFLGNQHFKIANKILQKKKSTPIVW